VKPSLANVHVFQVAGVPSKSPSGIVPGGGQVDDAPYGGGAGMVLRVDVVDAALRSALAAQYLGLSTYGKSDGTVFLADTAQPADDG
jgi:hypothetical protein